MDFNSLLEGEKTMKVLYNEGAHIGLLESGVHLGPLPCGRWRLFEGDVH